MELLSLLTSAIVFVIALHPNYAICTDHGTPSDAASSTASTEGSSSSTDRASSQTTEPTVTPLDLVASVPTPVECSGEDPTNELDEVAKAKKKVESWKELMKLLVGELEKATENVEEANKKALEAWLKAVETGNKALEAKAKKRAAEIAVENCKKELRRAEERLNEAESAKVNDDITGNDGTKMDEV